MVRISPISVITCSSIRKANDTASNPISTNNQNSTSLMSPNAHYAKQPVSFKARLPFPLTEVQAKKEAEKLIHGFHLEDHLTRIEDSVSEQLHSALYPTLKDQAIGNISEFLNHQNVNVRLNTYNKITNLVENNKALAIPELLHGHIIPNLYNEEHASTLNPEALLDYTADHIQLITPMFNCIKAFVKAKPENTTPEVFDKVTSSLRNISLTHPHPDPNINPFEEEEEEIFNPYLHCDRAVAFDCMTECLKSKPNLVTPELQNIGAGSTIAAPNAAAIKSAELQARNEIQFAINKPAEDKRRMAAFLLSTQKRRTDLPDLSEGPQRKIAKFI